MRDLARRSTTRTACGPSCRERIIQWESGTIESSAAVVRCLDPCVSQLDPNEKPPPVVLRDGCSELMPSRAGIERAGDRTRTGDVQLGKLAFYQLNYARDVRVG